ncbi:MAG: AbrB/MazE/SpoVT family DNA-binding domain-containing protein [Candidatus Thermoplasmatota archaeon]
MALTRKVRRYGRSFVVVIPSQIVSAFGIEKGMDVEIVPLSNGELIIRRVDASFDSRSKRMIGGGS